MTKNSKLSVWLFIPALILCFVVRFLQIMFGTDLSTGFLYDGQNIFLYGGYYAMLVVVFAAAVGLSVFDRKKNGAMYTNPLSVMVDSRVVVLGFALLFMGLAALYEAYADYKSVYSTMLVVVSAVFGVFFIALAFGVLYTKEIKPLQGFLMAGGGVYGALRVIMVFTNYMVVASIPERLINCLIIVGEAIFFMQLATLLSGNEGKNTRLLVTATGITTSVMILSEAMARIAADIFGSAAHQSRITMDQYQAELIYQICQGRDAYVMQYVAWVDVLAAVVMMVFLFAFSAKAKPVEITETTAEQPEAAQEEIPSEDTEASDE